MTERTRHGNKRRFQLPGKAVLATLAAVLACAVIGVLLGTYLHEVRGGPELSTPAAYDREHSTDQRKPANDTTTVTTIVVTEQPQQSSQRPPAPTHRPQPSTPSETPTTTPSRPPSSSSSEPTYQPTPSESSSSSSPTTSNTSTCGLLGCLFDPKR